MKRDKFVNKDRNKKNYETAYQKTLTPSRKRKISTGNVNAVKRGERLRSPELYQNDNLWNISSEANDMTRHNERRNAIGPDEKWQDALYLATEHMTDNLYGPVKKKIRK